MEQTNEAPNDDYVGTFVFELTEPIEDAGQLLVTVFNDIARVAYRKNSWDTWSPPFTAKAE